jgi:hypothetical protein
MVKSACIAVLVRIPYVKILVDSGKDFFYSSADVVICSLIESGLGITAANIVTLRPLFVVFLSPSRLFGESTSRKKSQGYVSSRSKSKSGGNSFLGVGGDEIGMKGGNGSGSVELEGKDDVESGGGRTEAGQKNERFQDDVAVRWDIEAQGESRERNMREPSLGITKTVRFEVVSETATLPSPGF